MAKSPEKNKGPRPVEIGIAAFLSALLGVVVAVAYLVFQAPEKVSELPDEEERELGKVYYVEGKAGSAAHGTWEAKKEAVMNGRSGSFGVVEQELNRWAAAELEEGEEPEDPPFVYVEPGQPEFRIAEGRLFVAAPLEWKAFGQSQTFDSHTSGEIKRGGDTYGLDYDRLYVGSCPVPGPLADRLFRNVVDSYSVSEELRNGWAALESVSIEDDSLKLTIP